MSGDMSCHGETLAVEGVRPRIPHKNLVVRVSVKANEGKIGICQEVKVDILTLLNARNGTIVKYLTYRLAAQKKRNTIYDSHNNQQQL